MVVKRILVTGAGTGIGSNFATNLDIKVVIPTNSVRNVNTKPIPKTINDNPSEIRLSTRKLSLQILINVFHSFYQLALYFRLHAYIFYKTTPIKPENDVFRNYLSPVDHPKFYIVNNHNYF